MVRQPVVIRVGPHAASLGRLAIVLFAGAMAWMTVAAAQSAGPRAPSSVPLVYVAPVDDIIHPISAEFILDTIDTADPTSITDITAVPRHVRHHECTLQASGMRDTLSARAPSLVRQLVATRRNSVRRSLERAAQVASPQRHGRHAEALASATPRTVVGRSVAVPARRPASSNLSHWLVAT